MQRREWTIWLVASAIFGASFWLVAGAEEHGPLLVAWKGAGVALLAVHALVFAIGHPEARRDAALLAMVMALGACGDMAIERSLTAGAGLFLVGHTVAIALYLLNPRSELRTFDLVGLFLIIEATRNLATNVANEHQLFGPIGIYSFGLTGMAAMAWICRFSRLRVATGALMFVASDLLIFARMGPLAGSVIPRLLVWPLYYGGQFLICTGVLAGLSRRQIQPAIGSLIRP